MKNNFPRTPSKKELALMYEMSYSNLQKYLMPHRAELHKLATKTTYHGKVVTRSLLNKSQMNYIVNEIFKGECPYGYEFNGICFVRLED